jgi:signal transduction histidine kinase
MADVPSDDRSLPTLLGPGPTAAIIGVVVFSLGWGLSLTDGVRRLVGLGLGALYLLLATVGISWAVKRDMRAHVHVLLVALAILGVTTMVVLPHSGPYLTLPLLSMLLMFTSLWWALAQTVVVLIAQSCIILNEGYTPKMAVMAAAGYGAFAIFVLVFTRMARTEQKAKNEAQRFAAQVAELATERERTRIARELHDSIGHALTALHVQIAAARTLLDSDTEAARECLDRAGELAHQGLFEARQAVTMLRSEPLGGRPFAVALDALVDGQQGEPRISLSVTGAPRPLAAATEFVLYRAVQEAITNIHRHAQATRAEIDLEYGESTVRLKVVDDGQGATSTDGGHGLIGLRERVQTVGGAVSVKTSHGQGFALDVEVPA